MALQQEVPRSLRGPIRTLLLSGLITLVLTAPADAFARQTVPPGNSEIDQYAESLPGAKGNQSIAGQTSGSGGGARSALSRGVTRRLEQLGPAGRAAANLAEATTPTQAAHAKSRGGGKGSTSGLGSVADTVAGSDGGGLGILLPLILGGVTATGLGYLALRRRARLPG